MRRTGPPGTTAGPDARDLIPENQSCELFINWAPRVARYSFHSGRVLQARGTGKNARATGRG